MQNQANHRPIIGLTGGIGSGKTAVSDAFGTLGITVVDADVIAHRLTEPDSPLLPILVDSFGDWVIDSDGNYDRAAMRAYVFSHPERVKRLNAIFHPAIRDEIRRELAAARSPYVILSVPLLFETASSADSLLSLCQQVLVVDVPVDIQLKRASSRDGGIERVAQIIDKQISRDERLAFAKKLNADILDNSQSLDEMRGQVTDLHKKYLDLANNA